MTSSSNMSAATVLQQLLSVINTDTDGDYFICKEARDIVDRAFLISRSLSISVEGNEQLTESQEIGAFSKM